MIGSERSAQRALAAVLCLSVLLAIVGCADTGAPDSGAPSRTTAPTAPSTEAPTADPEPQTIVLPDCESMNATIQGESDEFYALANTGGGVSAHRGEVDATIFNDSVGPVARNAMAEAVQLRGCTWPVQYHNIVTQYVAEIPSETQESLIAELRDSLYVESTAGPALRFDHTEHGDPDALITIDTDITYLFLGEVWIAIVGNGQLDYAQGALDGLFAVNPGLASAA